MNNLTFLYHLLSSKFDTKGKLKYLSMRKTAKPFSFLPETEIEKTFYSV